LTEEVKVLKDALNQVRLSLRTLSDTVSALRTGTDASAKATGAQIGKMNEQLSKLGETMDRLERSQSEPAARLGKVIETLDRLDKRAAAMAGQPEGAERRSAAAPLTQAAEAIERRAPTSVSLDTTASIPTVPAKPTRVEEPAGPPIVEGWTVRRVYDGTAFLDGRDRSIEVEAGDNIRGVGRVQEIRRLDGRWVVVTNRGLILSR
jgi:hypothetical protein